MSEPKIEIEETTDEEDYEDYQDETVYDISVSEDSSSSLAEGLKKLGDNFFKGENYKRYEESLKKKIPVTFILMIDNELVNMVEMFQKTKDIITNYNYFLDRKIKISPQDFILLFYVVNKDRSKKYLIENFNKLHELAGVEEYYIESFDDYKKGFERIIEFRMEKTKEDFKLLKDFYEKIEGFKTTDNYEDILNTFSEDTTKSLFVIKDNGYDLDRENTRIIFNNLEANPFFSYIRLDDENKSLYKVFTGGDKKYENFIDYNSTLEFEKNKLYLFYEFTLRSRKMFYHLKIDFETSKCEINYHEKFLDVILEQLRKVMPGLEIVEKTDIDLSGDFEMTIDNFDETKFY